MRYGAILVDLARHRLAALLPDRTPLIQRPRGSARQFFADRPQIEIVYTGDKPLTACAYCVE
ncbi:MAG: hypothetical protein LC769_03220, partial [Chloroflexi bacterium]|nr:hypothetical protein [Chloroflexota bacterium]